MFLSISLATCITASAFALEAPAVPPSTPETPAAAPSATPAVAAPAAVVPAAADTSAPAVAPPAVALSGKVIQTMNGAGYSYIYIEQADGSKKWVAVTQMPVKVGDQMTFKPGAEMGAFESKALNRTFDSIVFSEGVIAGGTTAAVADPSKNLGVSPGSQGAVNNQKARISVSKATGMNAITVEEAFANRTKLHGKRVIIHAQIVKVSGGILGKTWFHVQDGTGSARKVTHDLVCTSRNSTADVGDVVMITGNLMKDRNFGSGYKYDVMIEDAEFTKDATTTK